MNSGSLSTNQIKSAASDTAMRAPKVSAIMRARSAPSASVLCSAPWETLRYCGSLLLEARCAYKGCVGGTPSGRMNTISRAPKNAGRFPARTSGTTLPSRYATSCACRPRVASKISTGVPSMLAGSCGVNFSQ